MFEHSWQRHEDGDDPTRLLLTTEDLAQLCISKLGSRTVVDVVRAGIRYTLIEVKSEEAYESLRHRIQTASDGVRVKVQKSL